MPLKISQNEASFTFPIILDIYIVRGIAIKPLFKSLEIIFFTLFLTSCLPCFVSRTLYGFYISFISHSLLSDKKTLKTIFRIKEK